MDLDPPVRPATEPDGTKVLVGNSKCPTCGASKTRREPLKTNGGRSQQIQPLRSL